MAFRGSIVGLQIQSSNLKLGEHPNRRYDPSPLVPVSSLTVTQDGVCGWMSAGDEIVDVHHRKHPQSKNRNGVNGISVCFTSHYNSMRQHFGHHVADGSAGENILVELDDMVSAEDLSDDVTIHNANEIDVSLVDFVVAAPCVEFARFVLRFPDDATPDIRIKNAVQFLHHGMRGYYASLAGCEARVELGDKMTLH